MKRVGEIKEAFNAAPTELMNGCPTEFMAIHSHISSLTYQDEPNYGMVMAALKQAEDRRRQPEKDGEALDWEAAAERKKKKNPDAPACPLPPRPSPPDPGR